MWIVVIIFRLKYTAVSVCVCVYSVKMRFGQVKRKWCRYQRVKTLINEYSRRQKPQNTKQYRRKIAYVFQMSSNRDGGSDIGCGGEGGDRNGVGVRTIEFFQLIRIKIGANIFSSVQPFALNFYSCYPIFDDSNDYFHKLLEETEHE